MFYSIKLRAGNDSQTSTSPNFNDPSTNPARAEGVCLPEVPHTHDGRGSERALSTPGKVAPSLAGQALDSA